MELLVGILDPGQQLSYRRRPDRHAWLQVARGALSLHGMMLAEGDGAAISEEGMVDVQAADDTEVLLFDVA